ncbi:MAG: symmetrical bis(5'-nucleosyl)-tetraphosphatase [Gammaproteobacteria bacterium]
MTVYAIGDVQGCYDPLRRLLDKLDFDERRDTLWFAGDIVSRGPRSLKTLRFIYDLGNAAVTVLGNHDVNLIHLYWSGRSPRPADKLNPILQAHDAEELIEWLGAQPFAHFDAQRHAALVHAGVPPGWTPEQLKRRANKLQRYWQTELLDHWRVPSPTRWSRTLGRRKKLRYTLAALTRMRFCDSDGALRFDAKGHPRLYGGEVQPWFDHLHGAWRGYQVYFGHWSTLGDANHRDVISLDTGCVWGRQLTAVRVPKKVRNLIDYECVSCRQKRVAR